MDSSPSVPGPPKEAVGTYAPPALARIAVSSLPLSLPLTLLYTRGVAMLPLGL